MVPILAFVDGSGNHSFDIQGSHFIVASIIVRENRLADTEAIVEGARARHFQKKEIKSNKVADNHSLRMRI